MNFPIHPADAMLAAGYLAVLGLAFWWDRRRKSHPDRTFRDTYLAGSTASWPRIGFALYASTLSAVSLVGLTGSAYAHGISVFNYEWMAAIVLTIFCAFVLPIYLKSRLFTVPEFLDRRFGRFARTWLSGLNLTLAVVLDGAGGLFAGAVLFQVFLPDWPLWAVCALLAGLAGTFLIAGGLRAVMLIESVQGVVFVIACAFLAYFVFAATGGVTETLSRLDPDRLSLIRPANDASMPWIGLITGVPLIGFYFWCANQTMVQRTLAARTLEDGRMGSLLGGALKLTNLFLVILPGAAAVLLYPALDAPDKVLSHILTDLIPPGLRGIILIACLISLIAMQASLYNAASTLLTKDFVQRLVPHMSERGLMLSGRTAVVGVMLLSILWAPMILSVQDTLWQYLQAVLCYFVPPVAAVFLTGLFSARVNARGAACALWLGTASGAGLFVGVEIMDTIPLHFLTAAPVIFAISLAALWLGSLTAPAPARSEIEAMMFSRALWNDETEALKAVPWWRNYRILSLLLLALTGLIVLAFR